MPMVTRCPSCGARFRVTPRQLQARDGQVRCGRCMTVFDGFAALATTPERSPSELEPATARTAGYTAEPPPVGAAESLTEVESAGAEAAGNAPAMTDAPGIRVPAPPADSDDSQPVHSSAQAAASPTPRSYLPDPPVPPPSPSPPAYYSRLTTVPTAAISADESFLEQAHATPRRSARLWIAGCAAALLLLALQAVYVYRTDVAANYPALRSALAQVCAALGCSVPLPQRPKLINIEASDMQIVDPTRPGTIRLTATLRNHAGYDLGYPALDLVLTGTREHTLARRIFLPEEYLEPTANAGAGLAASAETTVRLVLDTGDLGAAGFRLDLLPAPAR